MDGSIYFLRTALNVKTTTLLDSKGILLFMLYHTIDSYNE